ncbi:MAG: hypothetical protein A2Y15_03055 [Clostridiales bacterium GWF2_36_10]|nr:MAG: hypothetical protein A2Y15_03055 [Clostridiales bacterium GWF2_36_10]HAN20952.1 hypothetical protein [Clostridiales bacterium]
MFTQGSEIIISNSNLVTKYGDKETILFNNQPFKVSGINITECNENGVFVYDINYKETAAPVCRQSFIDIVVVGDIVIWKGNEEERAIMPDKSGYIVRFVGDNVQNAEKITLGTEAETILFKCDSLPISYVKINDVIVEVKYFNTARTAEDTGFLYNSEYYSLTTSTNQWGIEYAVSGGKIIEINSDKGDTVIPQDGFVLSVGTSSTAAKSLKNIKVGDNAEYINESSMYSTNSIPLAGVNIARKADTLVVYTSEYGKKTLTNNTGNEVLVDKNGFVSMIYDKDKGNSEIPIDGGLILSANGRMSAELLSSVKVGSYIFFNTDKKMVYIVKTPETELENLRISKKSFLDKYDFARDKLYNIDYDKITENINKIETLVTEAQNAKINHNTEEYANKLIEGKALIEAMEYSFIPSLTVQDRAAWVTIAEETLDGNVLVHLKSEEDVKKYIDYTKKLKLNTLIIDAFAMSYSLYNSEIEGVLPLKELNGFDVVESFIRNGHEQGIEVHVMVCSFSGGSTTFIYPENHYMSIFKDKYLITNKGNSTNSYNFITLNPYDNDVRDFQLAIFSELVTKYDLDGIQIDYIRFPLPNYYQADKYEDFGYNEDIIKAFKVKYGVNPIDMKTTDNLWDEWCKFRREIISSFVEKTYKTVKNIKNNVTVSFTCFADYNDRQTFTYQDVEKWCMNGWVDALYPMIYAQTTEQQLMYAAPMAESIAANAHLVLGVGTYVRATNQSMTEQAYMPYELAADGISIFTVRYISTGGYYDIFANGAFKNEAVRTDKGKVTFVAGIYEIISNIDNVYLRFYKSDNLDLIKVKLSELLASSSTVADDENFSEYATEKLIEIRGIISIYEEKLSKKLTTDFDYLINCFTREANIASKNAAFN